MTTRRKQEGPADIALPITPFLDLAFQLLFFFIVIFKPPTAGQKNYDEGELRLSRPDKTSTPAATNPDDVNLKDPTHKEEVNIPVALTMRIKAENNPRYKGNIQEVAITDDNSETPKTNLSKDKRLCRHRVTADGLWKQLVTEDLEEFKPTSSGDKKIIPVIKMSVEKEVRWGEVVGVLDLCYKQGYQVSFARSPDDNSPD